MKHSRQTALLGACLYTLFSGIPAYADDTEIYFSTAALSGSTGQGVPNVLFLMDTSSSMNEIVPSNGQTRLDNLKTALTNIISSTNNINAGLMRMHYYGGPVMYPVKYINGDAAEAEGSSSVSGGPEVQIRVTDGSDDAIQSGSGTVSLSNTSINLVDASSNGSISVRVSASSDDAEQFNSSGGMYLNSSDLELVADGSTVQTIGLRFQNVAIPNGATVTSAELEFEIDAVSGAGWTNALNLTLWGEATDDANTFTSTASNISGRSKTSASVAWNSVAAPSVDQKLTSPSITSLVQEIVDRPGWVSGNDMAFVVMGTSSTVRREVEAWDGESAAAPLLRVNYTTSGGSSAQAGFRFQRVEIPQGVTINSAYLEFTASGTSSGSANWAIYGQNADDVSAFSSTSNDISSRLKTTANVAISSVDNWGTTDEAHQTSDITTVVQEIVNRSGWCGGNAMAFLLTGSGIRTAYSYEGNASLAPRLVVDYDPDSAPSGGGCINQTLQAQVSGGINDAEENSTGSVNLNSTDLELVTDGSTQTVGIRFDDIDIAQGATILSANLIFTADEAHSGATSLTIRGEDADNSTAFSTSSNNITSRTTTSASVAWSPSAWSTLHEQHTSPDIKTLVQEIVDRAGWNAGNPMSFIITGSGNRTAEAADDEAAYAPILRIQVQGMLGDGTASTVVTVRDRLLDAVNDLQYMSGTPIVDQLYEAALYYRGGQVDYGLQRGTQGDRSEFSRVSHPASYKANGATVYRASGCTDTNLNSTACKTEEIQGGTPTYISPMEEACQANYIVLLTDGEPSLNDSASKAEALMGSTCSSTGSGKCGTELISWMKNQDQASSLSGTQTITTHTIGFNTDSSGGTAYLQGLAAAGGGNYYSASDAAELTSAFQQIIAEILSTNTTFLAPAVTLNAFNRLTHRDELYYALFRPGGDVRWPGNIKRYKLNGGTIIDLNSNGAIDSNTGFFKETARSWWTATADGTDVGQGGAASKLTTTRTVYTYTNTSAPSNTSLNSASQLLHEDNSAVTKAMLGISGESDDYRSNLLKWSRGIDVNDDDGDGSSTDARTAMGDPLHSKPVLVTYGASVSTPDITLYASTNQGYLHAIDTSDGHEVFSFVPQELLGNLNTFYQDTGSTHPYGLDGPITVWLNDGNNNARVDTGEDVYLYLGMRRGGRQIYALNVADRNNPTYVWKITGGTGDFTELAETWSRPVKSKIKLNGTAKHVLIFAGGYDGNQESATTPANDTQGRAVYIVDALTGSRLWWAGPTGSGADLEHADFTNSIPADPRVIDIDNDGYADMIWLADTRGQVWRFDLKLSNTGASTLATGGTVAKFGGTTAANNRRFYYPPDVAIIKIPNNDYGTEYLSVSLGSGYRGHPLNTTIQDRFYSFRDPNVHEAPDSNSDGTPDYAAITESDMYDATANLIREAATEAERATISSTIASLEGWYIILKTPGGAFEGEKVLAEAVTVANQVMFTTYTPTASSASACQASEGRGRFYIVSILDGSPMLNLDETGDSNLESLTKTDRYQTLLKGGIPPEPSVIFPSDGSAPVTIIGTEVIEKVDIGDIISKTYWQEED
jgi:type IV pilus assembly protein PilY1